MVFLILGGKAVEIPYMDHGPAARMPSTLGDFSIVVGKASTAYQRHIQGTLQEIERQRNVFTSAYR